MSIGRHKHKPMQSGNPYLHRAKNRWYIYTRDMTPYEWSRVIAEDKMGRQPVRGEVVHHLNGDSCDDSPENLMVVTQKEHRKYHPTWGGLIPDDVLLTHLHSLASVGMKPTAKDIERAHGPSVTCYYRAFGSLTNALAVAGLPLKGGANVVPGQAA